jgi:hypothetical protein
VAPLAKVVAAWLSVLLSLIPARLNRSDAGWSPSGRLFANWLNGVASVNPVAAIRDRTAKPMRRNVIAPEPNRG